MAILSPVITITFPDGTREQVSPGITLQSVVAHLQDRRPSPVVGALINNCLRELTYPLTEDCTLVPIDLTSDNGVRIYWRSLSLVLVRAARELFPGCRVLIEHSLPHGIFGEIILEGGGRVSASQFLAVENRMREIVQHNEPIVRLTLPVEAAMMLFKEDGQEDKVRLLRYRKQDHVKVYRCGWLHDYFYGYMVPSTGFLKVFALMPYDGGFILRYPRNGNLAALPPFEDNPRLAQVFAEYERWGHILEVDYVSSLNDHLTAGRGPEIIRVAEALHEKKIAAVADQIAAESERTRLVLIAGPSSSGKTTFAQRLMVQLRVNGLRPVSVSLDDYFVDRASTPCDANGEFDFEALEAIDLGLFNQHLEALISGKPVELPLYNFKSGLREKSGRILQVSPGQPIIIEGIHGLNDRLTASIPKRLKFKIYVSALTQLNLDDHNRIPTTDNRIIRRIVRDHRTRGYSARETVGRWPSVRRGEERHIFPFQEEADVMFNSSLVYEVAVLKPYVEPLLLEVDSSYPEHPEVKRLLKFLQYFAPLDDCEVPQNSILREFIGKSCFYRE